MLEDVKLEDFIYFVGPTVNILPTGQRDKDDMCKSLRTKEEMLEVVRKLHLNKLSTEIIPQACNEVPEQLIDVIFQDKNRRLQRIKGITFLSGVFRNIDYVLIKDLQVPYALHSDIDVLLSNYSELIKAALILEKEGCQLYRFRLLAHPFKIMAKNCSDETYGIDLYPHPMWIRREVTSNEKVFQAKSYRLINGVKVPTPAPHLDFYLVATHAWSHIRLHLVEALHLLKLSSTLRETEWFYMVDIAEEWGTQDSIYIVALILNILSNNIWRYQVVPDVIVKELEKTYKASRIARKWLRGLERLEFPVRFPASLCVFDSSLRTFRALLRKSLLKAVYGFGSIYLSYFAEKLIGGNE